jgi:3-methyladenine DNA glycosylase AlkC
LDAVKQSQEATLQFVQTWSEGVTKLTSNLPELPKLPEFTALPKADEVSEQFFGFAQKLMTAQQEFVKKLIAVLPSQDVTAK